MLLPFVMLMLLMLSSSEQQQSASQAKSKQTSWPTTQHSILARPIQFHNGVVKQSTGNWQHTVGKSAVDSRPTNADDITVSRDTAAASNDDGFLSSHPVSKSAKSVTLQLQHQPGQTIKWRSQREKKKACTSAFCPVALLALLHCI
ncbi:hypothetical protein ACLKA7_010531 [Drosophila subpalustris]